MAKKHYTLRRFALLTAAVMVLMFAACAVCSAFTDTAEAIEKVATTAGLVSLGFIAVFGIYVRTRSRGSKKYKAGKPLVYVGYCVFAALAMCIVLPFAAERGTLLSAGVVLLAACALIVGFDALFAALIGRDKKIKRQEDGEKKKFDEWYSDRYGEEEQPEYVYIGGCKKQTDLPEYQSILCGGNVPKYSKSEGSSGALSALRSRGLLLARPEYEGLSAELLRVAICRLAENLGLDARITPEELAAELEKSDSTEMRNRRRDGLSTYTHDLNVIDRLLRQKGYAVVLTDGDEALAVVSEKNVDRLKRLTHAGGRAAGEE